MQLALLILDDKPESREALERDLSPFARRVRIVSVSSIDAAWRAIRRVENDGDRLAVAICDHHLPGTTGVEFMIQMADHDFTQSTRKVLITSQGDLNDTIRAVNNAHLDHFITKPWTTAELTESITSQLTDYVISMGINPLPYLSVLDQSRALNAFRGYGEVD